MSTLSLINSEIKPVAYTHSTSERQSVILAFMEEYENAVEEEKMNLLSDFEKAHSNFLYHHTLHQPIT